MTLRVIPRRLAVALLATLALQIAAADDAD
jgi:hypothetical protein